MKQVKLIVCVLSLFLMFGFRVLLGATSPPPDKTSEDIQQALQSTEWSKTRRLLVEFEILSPVGAPYHRIVAMAEPGELYTFSAHFPKGSYPWQSDPLSQEYFIQKGVTTHQWPVNRTFRKGSLQRGNIIPGSFPQDLLLPVLPIWLMSDYAVPVVDRSDVLWPSFVAIRSGKYSSLSQTNVLLGEDCVVFDRKGMDRMWLAANKGFCIMRRDIGGSSLPKSKRRILTDSIERVAPGLWLPKSYRVQFLSMGGSTNNGDVIAGEFKVNILRCLLNEQVPDSTFIPSHRSGSIEFFDDSKFAQVSPGGEDLLDEMVHFAGYLHLPTKSISHYDSYWWLLGGLIAGICTGFVIVSMTKWRFMKANSLHSENQKT